jgi:hypothetical protein
MCTWTGTLSSRFKVHAEIHNILLPSKQLCAGKRAVFAVTSETERKGCGMSELISVVY